MKRNKSLVKNTRKNIKFINSKEEIVLDGHIIFDIINNRIEIQSLYNGDIKSYIINIISTDDVHNINYNKDNIIISKELELFLLNSKKRNDFHWKLYLEGNNYINRIIKVELKRLKRFENRVLESGDKIAKYDSYMKHTKGN